MRYTRMIRIGDPYERHHDQGRSLNNRSQERSGKPQRSPRRHSYFHPPRTITLLRYAARWTRTQKDRAPGYRTRSLSTYNVWQHFIFVWGCNFVRLRRLGGFDFPQRDDPINPEGTAPKRQGGSRK